MAGSLLPSESRRPPDLLWAHHMDPGYAANCTWNAAKRHLWQRIARRPGVPGALLPRVCNLVTAANVYWKKANAV
jgi:hypothetical protein